MGATYDVHLGLIGKRVADFLLVLIELFSLGRTAEALRTKTAVRFAKPEVLLSPPGIEINYRNLAY